MELTILASPAQREEIGAINDEQITWLVPGNPFPLLNADAVVIDLTPPDPGKFAWLESAKLVIVNDPIGHSPHSNSVVRINGWNTFLRSKQWEAASPTSSSIDIIKGEAESALALLGKEVLWCADAPGLISARVVVMIINEAYLAVETGVSKKEDIDTAMKTGTNYPFGPFEWAEKIGKARVVALLHALQATHPKYQPASMLATEASNVTK